MSERPIVSYWRLLSDANTTSQQTRCRMTE
jgi:hypothetical protein